MPYIIIAFTTAYIISHGDMYETIVGGSVAAIIAGILSWLAKQIWEERKKKKGESSNIIKTSHDEIRKAHEKLIADMRALMQTDYNRGELTSSDLYQQLRPYLTEECRKLFEKPGTTVVFYAGEGHSGRNIYKETMAENLANIEREWKLI